MMSDCRWFRNSSFAKSKLQIPIYLFLKKKQRARSTLLSTAGVLWIIAARHMAVM